MITEKDLLDYVKTIDEISKPDNAGQKYKIRDILGSLDDLVELLFSVINDKENDSTLERLQDDFYKYMHIIVNLNFDSMPIAIEGLAQKYESFIKKIGYFKYNNTELWSGNKFSAGLTGTTLHNLCLGKISNRYGVDNKVEETLLPEPLINYKGVTRSFLDFSRTKLRNAVHYAPTINRKELIPYSEIVTLIYLLAIQDNLDFLSSKYSKTKKHNIYIQKEFKKWDYKYVHLNAEKVELDESIDFSPFVIETDWNENEEAIDIKREGSILEIFNSVQKLVIIGTAGIGKTTTLQFISHDIQKNAIKTPVYFQLNEYYSSQGLLNQILTNLGTNQEELLKIHNKGKLVFLLDGINEVIIENERISLLKEMNYLMKIFNNASFAITTRPASYQYKLNIPVFQLQPFTNAKIIEFVSKNFPALTSVFISNIINNNRLLDLCRSPLILKMLCSLSQKNESLIPENKGKLIQIFLDNLLRREKTKNQTLNPEKLIRYLVNLGYETRLNGRVSFNIDDAIANVSKTAMIIEPSVDRLKIIEDLCDLSILTRNGRQICFTHEIYQEYYAALYLVGVNIENVDTFKNRKEWEEPILLYSGLTGNRFNFVNELSKSNPVLTATCITSSIINEVQLENNVIETFLEQAKFIESGELAADSILGLIKLGYYKHITESLVYNFNRLNKKGLAYYSKIVPTIFKELPKENFVETAELFLSLDQAFVPNIVRCLENRDAEDLDFIIERFVARIDMVDFIKCKSSILYKLLKLLNYRTEAELYNKNIRHCLEYILLNDANNTFGWKIMKLLKISDDEAFVLSIFDKLTKINKREDILLACILIDKPIYTLKIMEMCLLGKNTSLKVASYIFCTDFNINSKNICEYCDVIRQQIGSCRLPKLDPIDDINKFNILITKAIAIIEDHLFYMRIGDCINTIFSCTVAAYNTTNNYYNLSFEGKRGNARIVNSTTNADKLYPNKKLNLVLAKVDIKRKVLYFVQNEAKFKNCSIAIMPDVELKNKIDRNNIAQKVSSKISNNFQNDKFIVTGFTEYYLDIKTEEGQIGRVPISNIRNGIKINLSEIYKLGTVIYGFVVSENNPFGLKVKLLGNDGLTKHDISIEENKLKNKKETLLGTRLKDALKNRP